MIVLGNLCDWWLCLLYHESGQLESKALKSNDTILIAARRNVMYLYELCLAFILAKPVSLEIIEEPISGIVAEDGFIEELHIPYFSDGMVKCGYLVHFFWLIIRHL